jgi:hypothetical protein
LENQKRLKCRNEQGRPKEAPLSKHHAGVYSILRVQRVENTRSILSQKIDSQVQSAEFTPSPAPGGDVLGIRPIILKRTMRYFQRLPWVVPAAAFPIAAAFFFKVPRVAFGSFTDAVFYLAYARQFGELVLRYGFPYYATRFGGILPDAFSGALFGEVNGIWILRYTLSVVASGALFLFFRKRYGVLAGLFASLLWSFNPAALRLICTTYVDATAVPFLILGCCLFASGWGGGFGALITGILVALAASAHLYAAFALLLLMPWFFASRWERRHELSVAFCWMGGGFLATFMAAWLWYWAVWRMPVLFSPTLEVLRDLGNGSAAQWKKPLAFALSQTPAWFAPAALLVPVAFSAAWGSALMRGVALSLVASIGFFWGGDLFGNAYVLSMPFYYSFLLPVTVLAGATLVGELLTAQTESIARRLLCLGMTVALVVPSILVYFGVSSVGHMLLFCLVCLFPLVPVWTLLRQRLRATLGLAGIALASLLVASTGMFAWIVGHYPATDLPLLELMFALRKELPKAVEDGSVTRFWYDDDFTHPGGADRRMIGAFWLHTFGKLTGESEKIVPFPKMSASDAAVISGSGVDRLVVFDQDPRQVNKSLEIIREKGIPFQVSKKTTLSAPSDPSRRLEVAILERMNSGTNVFTQAVNLHLLQAVNGGELAWKGAALELTSGTVRWWEFAKLPLGKLKKGESIRIRFRVEEGMIRFTLNDEKEHSMEHVGKWTMAAEQEIVLTAPRDLPDSSLSLDSMYPNGSRSRVLLKTVEKLGTQTKPNPQ